MKLKPADLTDETIQRMILDLVLDTPADKEHHAVRAKVKLEALRLVFEINQANKTAPDGNDTDDFGSWTPGQPDPPEDP